MVHIIAPGDLSPGVFLTKEHKLGEKNETHYCHCQTL